jgi:predicted ATPase/DNA-binding SARP family transcriptional activator
VVEPEGHVGGFAQAGLALRLLGGFDVSVAGRPVEEGAWRLRRAKTLLKLLALTPERRLHREQVTEALWPEGGRAHNGLHQVLYTARRALASGGDEHAATRLTLRDDVVTLSDEELWIDVEGFERAATAAREAKTPATYRAALDLYTGELLPEDLYEDWATARRESLREMHLGLLVELAELLAKLGDVPRAVEALQRAVIEDPLHELAHRTLMRLFAGGGRRQQALAQYQQLRQALRQRLEAEPDPETSRLYREILASQHGLQALDPPAPAVTPQSPISAPSRLPHQLTSFIGREGELSELGRLLERARLLTLTGPGGAGKTRLSLELAARQESTFEHGVYLVELAPVADPTLVVEETAMALGMQLRSERDPLDLLRVQIGERRLLLILDNCEHLVETCAAVADRLLRACPNLRVLATSRERLRIDGEVAWRVPPLSLPEHRADANAAELERFEAIRLFCQRAADAAPGFVLTDEIAATVAEICRRLDGMPLALELAAARAAVLSPAQIAERLSDALALLQGGSRAGLTRQQTLRATLTWSHDLLSEPERKLYRRLGVFAGSFGIEAVEGICTDGEAGNGDAVHLLGQLVDKSLVQVEARPSANRYRLLETVRQDARERLERAEERTPLEAGHRAWYLSLAEAADRDLDPTVTPAWSADRLEAEHDDLRAALGSAIRNDSSAALRMACSLWWFWMTRGYFAEGLRWLAEALTVAPDPTPERARGLFAMGALCVRTQGALARTVSFGSEALQITRREGDRHAEARALERLGVMGMGGFDWKVADEAFAEGLALAHEIGDEAVAVAIEQAQGVLAGCRGETELARTLLARSLALLAELPEERGPLFWATRISPVVIPAGPSGAPRFFFEDTFCLFRAVRARAGAGYVLCNIAETLRADGDYDAARDCLEESLARFCDLGDEQGRAGALNALGNLARSTGEFESGRNHFEQALAIRRAADDSREIAATLTDIGMLALRNGDRVQGQRLIDEALSMYERTEDAPGMEGIPLNLGAFALDGGDPERACELFARSATIGRQRGRLQRIASWASAELAEAAIAIGDPRRARDALKGAISDFERYGDIRGLRYANDIHERLERLSSGDLSSR